MLYKSKALLAIILALLTLQSCKTYERVNVSSGDFFSNNEVLSNIDKYQVYVSKGSKVYKLENVSVSSGAIVGMVKESTDFKKAIKRRVKKNDLQIAAKAPASLSDTTAVGEKLIVFKDDIRDVTLSAKSKSKVVKVVVGVVLGIVAIVLLLWAAVAASAQGSSQSSQQSGNSNSNSGSGNSNSGCYVATMTYGSYDHPQVWVLRNFRDRFLLRYRRGQQFVQWYYRHSPQWVEQLRKQKIINSLIKIPLNTLVWVLKRLGY